MSDNQIIGSFNGELPYLGMGSYFEVFGYASGNMRDRIADRVRAAGATEKSIMLSSPTNQALGLGRTWRIKGSVPAAVLDNFDAIQIEVSRRSGSHW